MSRSREFHRGVGATSWASVLSGLAILVISACGVGSQAVGADPAKTAPLDGTSGNTATEPVETAPPEADVTVVLYNYYIDAPEVVAAGSEILVINVGTSPHDWGDRDGTFSTERIGEDEWELITVDEPGVYDIVCTLHPTTMRTTLEVTNGPVPDADVTQDDGTATVELTEYAFVGNDEFAVGTQLTVTNIGRLDHDLTSGDGTFATSELAPGASEMLTLDTPGTYNLVCTLHPNDMRRTVTVTA